MDCKNNLVQFVVATRRILTFQEPKTEFVVLERPSRNETPGRLVALKRREIGGRRSGGRLLWAAGSQRSAVGAGGRGAVLLAKFFY